MRVGIEVEGDGGREENGRKNYFCLCLGLAWLDFPSKIQVAEERPFFKQGKVGYIFLEGGEGYRIK